MAQSLALCDITVVQHQLLWLPSWYLTQLGISLCFSILHCGHWFPVTRLRSPWFWGIWVCWCWLTSRKLSSCWFSNNWHTLVSCVFNPVMRILHSQATLDRQQRWKDNNQIDRCTRKSALITNKDLRDVKQASLSEYTCLTLPFDCCRAALCCPTQKPDLFFWRLEAQNGKEFFYSWGAIMFQLSLGSLCVVSLSASCLAHFVQLLSYKLSVFTYKLIGKD